MSDDYEAKREHHRKAVTVEVRITQLGTESLGELLFETADLSVGGAFLRSELLLERGEEVNVAMEVPGVDGPIIAMATVVWTTRADDARGAGMGLQFHLLDERDRFELQRYLRMQRSG